MTDGIRTNTRETHGASNSRRNPSTLIARAGEGLLERAMRRGMLTLPNSYWRSGHRVAVTLMYHHGHVAAHDELSILTLHHLDHATGAVYTGGIV